MTPSSDTTARPLICAECGAESPPDAESWRSYLTDDAPLKVSRQTKEKVRLGAAMLACTQGELVERAVAEFLERHAEELNDRVEGARNALLGDSADVVGYLLEVDPDDVRCVAP